MKNRSPWLLPALAAVMMVADLYLIFVWAPTEMTMGIVQKIFYFHMPAFVVAAVAIIIGMVAAIRFLISRDYRFDELSVAAIEVGLIFDTMNLFTGPFWAKPVWGIWWRSEERRVGKECRL